MNKPNGLIVYRGASRLTGGDIVAIATGTRRPSANEKTGPMIQVWILSAAADPVQAVKRGADDAICGDCPLRTHVDRFGRSHRACYVVPVQAPLSIYRAWQKGIYPIAESLAQIRSAFDARVVRIGAYGDPAALPIEILEAMTQSARRHTTYTHQWRATSARGLRSIAMASVESVDDARRAHAAGWRTFRVKLPGAPLLDHEITCPASIEAGARTTCYDCGLCNGASPGARQADPRAHIAIDAHGSGAPLIQIQTRG